MEIIITGGRDYKDRYTVCTVLDILKPSLIIQGGASGADDIALQYAKQNNIPYKTYKADWEKHGRAAGPIRNKEMCTRHPEAMIVAFKGGRGTENCIKEAEKLGMLVYRVTERLGV